MDILALVGRLGVTAVIALHDLNLAATFCDELVVLSSGRVVASGTPGAVLTEDLIATVYGVGCEIGTDRGRPFIRFERPHSAAATDRSPGVPTATSLPDQARHGR